MFFICQLSNLPLSKLACRSPQLQHAGWEFACPAFCLKGKSCLVFQCFHQILQHSVWRENHIWCFNSFNQILQHSVWRESSIWCFNSFTKFLSCSSLYSIVRSRWVYFTFGSPPQSFLPYSDQGSPQNEVFSYSLWLVLLFVWYILKRLSMAWKMYHQHSRSPPPPRKWSPFSSFCT